MYDDSQPDITRVWWDEEEVRFVRWTEKALVFCWGDARGTAVQMPRGAVVRLLDKGVLRVEGTIPDWLAQKPTRNVYATSTVNTAPPPPPPPPDPAAEKKANLFNAITRLIRKLGGGDPVAGGASSARTNASAG